MLFQTEGEKLNFMVLSAAGPRGRGNGTRVPTLLPTPFHRGPPEIGVCMADSGFPWGGTKVGAAQTYYYSAFFWPKTARNERNWTGAP